MAFLPVILLLYSEQQDQVCFEFIVIFSIVCLNRPGDFNGY